MDTAPKLRRAHVGALADEEPPCVGCGDDVSHELLQLAAVRLNLHFLLAAGTRWRTAAHFLSGLVWLVETVDTRAAGRGRFPATFGRHGNRAK